jgi:hypothetical protein
MHCTPTLKGQPRRPAHLTAFARRCRAGRSRFGPSGAYDRPPAAHTSRHHSRAAIEGSPNTRHLHSCAPRTCIVHPISICITFGSVGTTSGTLESVTVPVPSCPVVHCRCNFSRRHCHPAGPHMNALCLQQSIAAVRSAAKRLQTPHPARRNV